jgi:hypothetical protein
MMMMMMMMMMKSLLHTRTFSSNIMALHLLR